MSDPDVCIFCAATGCSTDTAEHGSECPFITGLWPVTRGDVERGDCCLACSEPFAEGDVSAQIPADRYPASGIVNQIAAEWDGATLTLCLPCVALGRQVES